MAQNSINAIIEANAEKFLWHLQVFQASLGPPSDQVHHPHLDVPTVIDKTTVIRTHMNSLPFSSRYTKNPKTFQLRWAWQLGSYSERKSNDFF